MDNCQLFLKLKEKRSARVKNFCKTRFICKKQRAYALCFLVGGYYVTVSNATSNCAKASPAVLGQSKRLINVSVPSTG